MDLGLEIIESLEDISPGEVPEPKVLAPIRLRDSHHRLAMLVSKGLGPAEVSAMTGTSVARIYTLARDPAFKDLVHFYRNDNAEVHRDLQAKMEDIARDALEVLHERVQDRPDTLEDDFLLDLSKVTLDRAGYAPVQRTINKSLHMTIGARFDRAESRKKPG